MAKSAARIGDLAGHGGSIIFGASTVFIGGKPAARVGDPLVCPGFDGQKPHIMGNIIMGSCSVIIEGGFAARIGDPTGCGVAGISGANMPAVIGPAAPTDVNNAPVSGDEDPGLLFGQYLRFKNSKGTQYVVKESIANVSGETNFGNGNTASGSAEALTASVEVHTGPGGGSLSAQAAAATAEGRITSADGSSLGGSVSVASANAGATAIVGSNGRITGVRYGVSAGVSAVEGEGNVCRVTPIPVIGCDIKRCALVGNGIGLGGGIEGGAYHDADDDRYHAMGMVDMRAIIKVKVGADISVGCKRVPLFPPPAKVSGVGVPMSPGTIVTGCFTVLIG